MDVRRRLVGLALCSIMLVAGIAVVPGGSTTRAAGALTIDGQYESAGPLAAGEVRNLLVTGRGGVPAIGVGAVALNVTVTNPTASSFLTVWPTGTPRPTAANLNFTPGQTVPNMVVVKVGDYGQVSMFNYAGSADVVVDVMGWFPVGTSYTGLAPARLADSRVGYPTIDGLASGTGPVGAGATSDLTIVGRGGVPLAGAGAVALNVTVTNPTASSFLTVWPTGAPRPTAANLNYTPGLTVPNMVIVKLGAGGKVSMFNYAGSTDIVVDVMGWFPDTGSFAGLTPARLLDTRAGYPTIDGLFSGTTALHAAETRDLTVVGRGGVPATGVGAVVLNLTVTNPTAPSFITVWPAGTARPLSANLNFVPGQTVPNMVIVKVGDGGKISMFNYGGNVDVIVDVMGWFPNGVGFQGITPARLMDSRPGGTPSTPTLPTTTVPGAPTTTAPAPTTTTPAPTTTVPPTPPAPWTEQAVHMPTQPRNDTPRITDGEIFDIEVIGSTAYVLGSFTAVADAPLNGGGSFAQRSLIAYDIDNGQLIRSFMPTFDNAAHDVDMLTAMAKSADGLSLFITGRFSTVNGVTRQRIVKLNAGTGAVDTAFTANANARATAVAVSSTSVYVGGQFTSVNGTSRSALVALDPTTGAVDTGFNLPITGGIGAGGLLTVQALVLSHDVNQSTLLVVHTGRQISGQDRYGVGLIDTVGKSLRPWRTNLFQDNLVSVGGVVRAYAGDIAPNDSYFVVTSGSGGDRPPISDVAIAFPVAGSAGVEPLWVSRSFDSVYSVAITADTVFVGGHFSWEESPRAPDPWPGLATVGYGTGQGLSGYALGDQVVRRDQLGALDPVTGKAQEWNPGANAFEGVKTLTMTPRGLFVGGDATTFGGRNIGRTAFFDLADAPTLTPADPSATIVSPYDGLVVDVDSPVVIDGTATAGTGNTITFVRVEVQQKGSPNYVCANGTIGTQVTCPYIPAVLASPGAASTAWSLSINLPAGQYYLRARTFTTGATSPSIRTVSTIETFRFADATPDTTISLPLSGQVTTNTFTVTGTAVDDHGVASMSYYAENLDTRQYLQDDGSTASAYNSFEGLPDVVGQTNATWTLELTLPNGSWRLVASAIDTAGQADLRGAAQRWIVDPTGQSPTVTLTSPVTWNPPVAPATSTPSAVYGPITPGSVVTFTGTAADDTSVNEIDVALRNNSTGETLAADGTWGPYVPAGFFRVAQPFTQTASWSFSPSSLGISLSPGVYTFRVRAIDNFLLSTTTANTASVSMTVQVPGDAFPTETINAGPSGLNPDQSVEALHLDLSGTASDNAGVNNVRVVINDLDTATYLTASGGPMSTLYTVIPAVLGSPGAASSSWSLSVNLPAQGEYNITVTAVDSAGQYATAGATWRYLVYPGDTDPVLVAALNTPADNATLPTGSISIAGRGEDDNGMSGVRITIRNSANQYFSTTTNTFAGTTLASINAFLTSPGSPGSNFNYATPQAAAGALVAGAYTITVTPVDNWGQVGASRTFTVNLA